MTTTTTPTVPAQLFFSYSHKDEELRDKLAGHFSGPRNEGVIGDWHDRRITAGEEWAGKIDEHLETADIILLLISADFLSSPYCYEVEMQQAMRRHEAGQACVIPIILRPVVWRHTPFARLQALPKNAQPVTSWADLDQAMVNVTEGILKAAEDLRRGLRPDFEQQNRRPGPAPPPEPPPSIHEKQSVSARKGIEVFINLIRDDPAVRSEAVKFRSDFERLQGQIQKLRDYKDLHDLLHELQVHSYKAIVDEADRFPDDKSREVLSEYEFRLGHLVGRLDETTSRSSFSHEQVTWMEKLHEARQALFEAIDGPEPEKLKLAIRLMKSVLGRQPSKIATRLNALAGELRLESLVAAMGKIHERIAPLDSDIERLRSFVTGAHNLKELNGKLTHLMEEHFRWQEVDDDLRRVEDCLEEDLQDLVDSWPDIKAEMAPLYGPDTSKDNSHFRAEGDKLDSALKENNPFRIRHSFRRYRSHATMRFYETDKKLRDLCGSLTDAAAPLHQLLQVLGKGR